MSDIKANDTESLFRRTGAVLEGHFLLTSGLHSPVYFEKFRILAPGIHAAALRYDSRAF